MSEVGEWDGPFYLARRDGYEIGCLLDRWRGSGECLDGGHFWVSDGLIVREPGLPAMVRVIDHLVETGEYTSVLQRLGPEACEE
ncbi:hypothetical protein ACPA54_13435 [Uniformispora flossi]|uniref:hypothetical protein n=1 Tax=Uniformispora flossi TaxID=3390723 RepID=UPI003C2D771A